MVKKLTFNQKQLPYVIVAVVVIAILGGVAIYSHDQTQKKADHRTTVQKVSDAFKKAGVTDKTKIVNATTPIATSSVDLINATFNPSNITVVAGSTVTWTNRDTVPHDVIESDSQAGPASPSLNKGDAYTYTYSTPGTYKYHSAISPSMMGTVTVTGQ